MDKKSLFKCPVCSKPLIQSEKRFYCGIGHSFDISSKGYVNLLLPNHKGAGDPGDSKEMLQGRREFLNKGYYESFSDRLNRIVYETSTLDRNEQLSILDAGCGEGYYTWRLRNMLAASGNQREPDIYGIDVSKAAIHYASGRDRSIHFAVASNYHIPVLPACMDYIICVFAPRDEQEFWRVLKPEGKLIIAAPGPRHLYSLRKTLYENPELIGQKGTVEEGFVLSEQTSVSYEILLNNAQDIFNLLLMTPYSRHTDDIMVSKLKKLDELVTEVDINIMIYSKDGSNNKSNLFKK